MSAAERSGEDAPRQELGFVYRVQRPAGPPHRTLVLLHGSGADETTMLPLGRKIDAQATLIAVRDRIVQQGSRRWFTRIDPTRFRQKSIRTEARAFARLVGKLAVAEGFDPERAVFVGYSNGANLVSSAMLLHPGLIRRAVLLRAMPVLDHAPDADLAGARVLVVAGARDETYGPFAPALASLLRARGACVEARTVSSGHEFGLLDAERIRAWLEDRPPAGQVS